MDQLSLSVGAGEFVSLVGPTGAGKSTLLRVVAGLETHFDGEVLLDGDKVIKPSRDVQLVFQDLRILPWKTVEENMYLASPRYTPKKKMKERAQELLDELGLMQVARAWPTKLSGGQRTSLAFARAFMDPPKMLLLDEPFVGLDLLSRCKLRESLTEATLKYGTTTMMVSHSVDDAVFLSDRVLVFDAGPLRVRKAFKIASPRSERRRSDTALLQSEADIANLLLSVGEI